MILLSLVLLLVSLMLFFCFKQKTAYELRISDWSSDVCSSDLVEAVKGCVRRTARALTDDFGIAHPRIVVAGLNPHAGEGGTIGREEVEIIAPAIAALRSEGSRVGKASVSKSRSRWAPVN